MDVIGGVIKESKGHPFTMLALVGLLLAVPYVYHNSASAADVTAIQAQLQKVQASINRNSLEQRIAAVESELFTLNQKVNEKLSARQKPEQIYYDRINTLTIEKARLERDLGALR